MIAQFLKISLAASLTVAVFLLMRFLIIPSNTGPQEVDETPTVNITRPERNETTITKERYKPPKPQRKQLPPIARLSQPNLSGVASDSNVGIALPTVMPKPTSTGSVISDRYATPLVRIPPQYPNRAIENGIEGWVMVEFTINLAGAVEDVVIIDAEPPRIFDRAVIRALQRWKYQPKLVNGKPVPQYNMRDLIKFEIER